MERVSCSGVSCSEMPSTHSTHYPQILGRFGSALVSRVCRALPYEDVSWSQLNSARTVDFRRFFLVTVIRVIRNSVSVIWFYGDISTRRVLFYGEI